VEQIGVWMSGLWPEAGGASQSVPSMDEGARA
jgi:hypothetical protein